MAAEQIILLVLQKIILKSDFEMRALLQLPTAILFGVFCDVAFVSLLFDFFLRVLPTFFFSLSGDLHFGGGIKFPIYCQYICRST